MIKYEYFSHFVHLLFVVQTLSIIAEKRNAARNTPLCFIFIFKVPLDSLLQKKGIFDGNITLVYFYSHFT